VRPRFAGLEGKRAATQSFLAATDLIAAIAPESHT